MSLLRKARVLAAKIEVTSGTAVAMDATDADYNAFNVEFQYNIPMEERQGQGGFGRLQSVPGGRIGTITFTTEVSYDGVNIPTWASTFLPACGWVESGGVYKPIASAPGAGGVKTLTMSCYENGKVKKLVGASGAFTIDLPAGKLAKFNWTFTGKVATEADASILAPTYPTVLPSRFAGGFFKYNSVTLCPEMVTVDSGNKVSMLECPTDSSGYLYAFVGDRNPMIKANPLAVLIATVDRFGYWMGMSEYAIDIEIPGVTGSVDIQAPKAQIVNIQETDRNGMIADSLDFQCNRNASTQNEELSITFNAA